MSGLYARKNFAEAPLDAAGIDSVSTTLNLSSGGGAEFPNPGTAGFLVTVWNDTDYPGAPYNDPNVERMLVTAKSTDALTVTRAQDGTSAAAHNTASKTYRATLSFGKAELDQIELRIQDGTAKYVTTGGAANAYTATMSPTVTAYVAGQTFRLKASFSNTGSATLSVDSLGAKTIKTRNGGVLGVGAIYSGDVIEVTYDGTDFYLMTPDFAVINLQNQTAVYGTIGGSGSAYTLTVSPTVTAYVAGQRFSGVLTFTNTGAATLNVSGLGNKSIKAVVAGSKIEMPANSLASGDLLEVVYDGTDFVLCKGPFGPALVAVADPSAASSVSFTGLTAGKRYKVVYDLTQVTSAGILQLRFNNDSGANYRWASFVVTDAGSTGANAGTGDTEIQLTRVDSVAVGFQNVGEFTFAAKASDTTIATLTGNAAFTIGTSLYQAMHSGYYDGASAITRFDLIPSAGTITGRVFLYQLD